MMSKPSKGGQPSPSGADNEANSVTNLDEESFFRSACSETLEDGKLVLSYATASNDKEPLHTGKWTDEEMAYAEGLIDEFREGNLAIPDGTSLRQFLAKMLNCSPKRISKRYEGNNYSKGRKFYVKSTGHLGPAEAQLRRSKLQELERRHKQRLLQLKIPHLLIADRSQPDPVNRDSPKVATKKKSPPLRATNVNVNVNITSNRGPGGGDSSSASVMTGNLSASGSAALPTSNVRALPGSVLDQSIYSNLPQFRETAGRNLLHSSLLHGGQSLPPSSTLIDELLVSDATLRPPSDVDLLVQLRAQQAESQRLSRLLELQRGYTTPTGNLGPSTHQQQLNTRASLLQRDLEPSPLLGGRLTSLLGAGQTVPGNELATSQQLQDLILAEEARTAAILQESTMPLPMSRVAGSGLSDAMRRASSTAPFLSSAVVASAPAASLDRESDLQINSLLQMQLQAQQTASSRRLGQRMGLAQLQEHKIGDEDLLLSAAAAGRAGAAMDGQVRQLLHAQPSSLLAAQAAALQASSSGLQGTSSASAQQSPEELYTWLQLRSSTPVAAAAAAASAGPAGRGQKRGASDEDVKGPNQRRRY